MKKTKFTELIQVRLTKEMMDELEKETLRLGIRPVDAIRIAIALFLEGTLHVQPKQKVQ